MSVMLLLESTEMKYLRISHSGRIGDTSHSIFDYIRVKSSLPEKNVLGNYCEVGEGSI